MTLSHQADIRRMAFWGTRWKNHLNRSFLRQTQKQTPEQWQAFYDRVAGIWSEMAGLTLGTATAVVHRLVQDKLIRKDSTVLDIGCGPGSLTMALANQQMQVTALDRSKEMIRMVKQRLANQTARPEGPAVRAVTGDWHALPDMPVHDAAIAAFFPEACSPDGIHHLETLATDTCLLIMGDGTDTFSLRRQIWARVMPAPFPGSGFHHVCAEGYLSAAGRAPRISLLSIPVTLEVDKAAAHTFFHAYFSMFGVPERDLVSAIQEALFPWLKQGRVYLQGTAQLVLVGWQPCSYPVWKNGPC
jgi:SAM-dependent methyltransferase